MSRSGVRDRTHNSVRRRSQRSKRSIQSVIFSHTPYLDSSVADHVYRFPFRILHYHDSLEAPSSCMKHLVFGTGEGLKGTAGPLRDATQAFLSKFNIHTRTAREMMKDLSVATVRIGADDVVEFL